MMFYAAPVNGVISTTSSDVTASENYIGWYPMTQWTGAVGALTYDSITLVATTVVDTTNNWVTGVTSATWLTAGSPFKARSTGVLASPLSTATVYYAGKPDADKVQFYTTYADSIAGTNVVDLTTQGTNNIILFPANVKDWSGQGNDLTFGACLDTQIWATAPYMSSISSGSVDGSLANLAVATLNANWSWPTQSMLAFFRVKCGTLVPGRTIFGCGASSSVHGPRISLDSTNGDQATVQFYGASSTVLLGTSAAVCFSTSDEHSIALGLDASTLKGSLWIDGERDLSVNNIGISAAGTVLPTTALRIGGATSTNSQIGNFRDYHLLSFTGGLPSNVDDLVAKIHTSLYCRLLSTDC